MDFLSQITNSRGVRVGVCAVLLIGVLIAVVSPQVNILPTVLRAQRIAYGLLLQCAALVFVLWLRSGTRFHQSEVVLSHPTVFQLSSVCCSTTWVLRC
jgi:hypothetical protein